MATTIDILDNYIDNAGFRRVVIQVDSNRTYEFKFEKTQTVAQMKEVVKNFLQIEQERINTELAEQQRIATITKACQDYYKGTLTNNQKVLLLEALIAEWKG